MLISDRRTGKIISSPGRDGGFLRQIRSEGPAFVMRLRFTNKAKRFETELPTDVADAMVNVGDVFEAAGARPWPDEDDDWDCVVDVERLREALADFRTKFREQQKEPAYVYLMSYRSLHGEGHTHPDYGGISGFRINGDPHFLRCGYEECTLIHSVIDADGKGRDVERRDVRHLSVIETDNWGPIYITKKKAQDSVQKWVAKVLRKLKPMEGDVVVEFA
ncbi:MAG: hypothetical protein R3E58_15090 [Phycisphaerae bacterium]|nr:hypothetical protein [Phycisphaerales bacterium]